jgi:FlgD Ig-like domain/Fibronectin type III domain
VRLSRSWAAALWAGVVAVMSPHTASAQITLRWTAPGDDGIAGRATRYEVRWSAEPITPGHFFYGVAVTGLPAPAVAGTLQTFTIPGLDPNRSYYFVIRTQDEAGNWSPLSNLAFHAGTTTEVNGAPSALEFGLPTPNPARVETRFAITLPNAMDLHVEAFDLAGRRVRVLAEGPHAAGAGDIEWDLRDDQGNPLRAGMYLVRARIGDTVWLRRVAVVR